MRPHSLASILAAGLAIGAAVGCGSDPPPRLAYTSITPYRAHAVARELTIREADLPEFKVTAHAAATQEGFEARRYNTCVRLAAHERSPHGAQSARGSKTAKGARQPEQRGAASHPAHRRSPSLRAWASAKSDVLSAGSGYHTLGALSSVSIEPTSAAARLEVAQAKNLNRTCMEHVVRAGLAKQHLRLPIAGVVLEPFSASVGGADTSAAYRAVLAYHGAPLVLYMDMIFFSYGQDLFMLSTYHSSKPVPSAMEERLLGLLVARARSHSR
jgi:hypothetical protein